MYRNQINKQFATDKKSYRDISGKKPIRSINRAETLEPKKKSIENIVNSSKKINHDIDKIKIEKEEEEEESPTNPIETPIIINPMPAAQVKSLDLEKEYVVLKDRITNLELFVKSLSLEVDNLVNYQTYIVEKFNKLSTEFIGLKNKLDKD